MRHFLALAGVWLALAAGAGPTAAAEPADPAPDERRILCTPFGCRRAPPDAWTKAAAFGATVVLVGWLGRRARAGAETG